MEEEIEMQQEWRDDERKCTFIILARDLTSNDFDEDEQFQVPPPPIDKEQDKMIYPYLVERTLVAMIGDINLFLSEEEDDVDTCDWNQLTTCNTQADERKLFSQAELDIMIAKESHRHKGLGAELALMMMHYGASALGIRRFFVKIKDTNTSSIRLFRDKLGFVQCSYAECFGEYEFECKQETAAEMTRWVQAKWNMCCIDTGENVDNLRLYDVHKCPLNE
jgi:RimJ/RimL family protein N-acetyltransferase